MANDLIPYKRPGEDLTCNATAAVIGKRCVQITAAKVNHAEGLAATADGGVYQAGLPSAAGAAGAGKRVLGVAKYDAALGALFGVVNDGVVPITTSAIIGHGQLVEVAADGTIIPNAAGVPIGMALDDAASGADAEILLLLGS